MEIAVIGMAGRFPGAGNINEFWDNLIAGIECISFFSEEELLEDGVKAANLKNPAYVKANGIIEDKGYFDASFFGYTPEEAEVMDPQTRMFHECAWEALENAAYDPGTYKGAIGLFAGASSGFAWEARTILLGKNSEVGEFAANYLMRKDFLAARISYTLDLKGPSSMIYTACSTSLVAIHQACRALLTGECKIAMAGGVSLRPILKEGYWHQEGMVASSDGHCRAFDAKADGCITGEGAALVVLKRLKQAIQDNDFIYAVVKGSAANNDGNRKVGFTAPSVEGQIEVIRAALHMARVQPESISCIETHGTGTPLGDPVEVKALTLAFQSGKKQVCAIGSVKTNIGHLDAAAGAAGFIKMVLALYHKKIPPSLHFNIPNPKIDFENSPFYVNTTPTVWKNDRCPLRAGVNSLGIGGTNAHVILEEWSKAQSAKREAQGLVRNSEGTRGLAPLPGTHSSRQHQLVLLSAKTGTALDKMTENLTEYFRNNLLNHDNHENPDHPGFTLANAAYTLQTGRRAFQYRKMLVSTNVNQVIESLSAPGSREVEEAAVEVENIPVIFMFSGQGAQYVNIGLDLYQQEPLFREEVDRCFTILDKQMGCKLKDILYPGIDEQQDSPGMSEAAEKKIDDVLYSGPIKFTIEYALAKLLMKWGIKPHAMIGHSFGEYAAAHISGVFSLEDALRLVVVRGRLMAKTPPAVMMSVPLGEEQLKPILNRYDKISLAAVNTPWHCIVSGPAPEVEIFEKELKEKGHECLYINFPRASHSKMMAPIAEEFEENLRKITLNKPKIPYIAGLTGNWVSAREAADPRYWSRHFMETVRFLEGIKILLKEPNAVFVQVSSDRGLPLFIKQLQEAEANTTPGNLVLNLLRHPREKVSDVYYMLKSLGALWLHGVNIDWSQFGTDKTKQRIPLPTYPFRGQPFGIEGNPGKIGAQILQASKVHLVKKADISDWFYVPSWVRSPLPGSISPGETMTNSTWVVFTDEYGLGDCLVKQLEQVNCRVITLKIARDFKKNSRDTYSLDPKAEQHYNFLLREFKRTGVLPTVIVHLWSIDRDRDTGAELELSRIEQLLAGGLYSLFYLVRALGSHEFTDPLRIGVVCSHLQEVTGEEILAPGKAALMGPVKVIPLEYPNIKCCCMDIQVPEPGGLQEKKVIEQVIRELCADTAETIIAFRGNHRWAQTFKPVRLKPPADLHPRLREKGVYLITGGLGGIGLVLAEHLAKQVKARLILTGRSEFPAREEWEQWCSQHGAADSISRKITKIKELEALGAEIIATPVDATDKERMQAVISRALKQFNRIHGVIHAAGVPDGAVIQRRSREMTENILAPKVKGTLVLHKILKDLESKPEFFVLCSSVNAILPAPGQLGHGAANAFLDAYALHEANHRQTHIISINWNAWLEVGQAAEARENLSQQINVSIKDGLLSTEGIEVFNRVLAAPFPQMVVSTNDFNMKAEHFNTNQPINVDIDKTSPEIEKTTGETDVKIKARRPRPPMSTAYAAPHHEIEKKLAQIWQDYFGYEKVGVRDDFFALGGDSLKAMIIIARIHKALEVKISVPVFFANPTVEELCRHLAGADKSPYSSIEPVEKREYYPLSSAQKRLFFLEQFENIETSYNVPLILPLDKNIDINKLEASLEKLIARHESLRTSFEFAADAPIQRIHQFADCNIDYYEADEERAKEMVQAYIRPFDLGKAPLLRSGIIKLPDNNHIWMVDMHHIISDGTSDAILAEDFIALYNDKELPELRLQYKDFSQWQNDLFEKGNIKAQEEYWLNLYAGEIPRLNLPTDYPRSRHKSFAGDEHNFALNGETAAVVKKMCLKYDVTLYMNLLAAFNVLLFKYTGQNDIIVGTGIVGRPHDDLKRIMGMFVNTLPMRNYPKDEKTYLQFLQEVKENTVKAFENQDMQFETLVEQLSIKRDPARSPLFDVELNVQNFEKIANTDGLDKVINEKSNFIKPYRHDWQTAKFDLLLFADEKKKSIRFHLEYSAALFKPDTIEAFARHYTDILNTVTDNHHIRLKDIKLTHDFVEIKSNNSYNGFGFEQ